MFSLVGFSRPFDLVQVVVIETAVERLEALLQVGEVHEPAALGFDRTGDVQLDPERVAVEPTALVPLGHVWEAVRCLEGELLEDLRDRDAERRRVRVDGDRSTVRE